MVLHLEHFKHIISRILSTPSCTQLVVLHFKSRVCWDVEFVQSKHCACVGHLDWGSNCAIGGERLPWRWWGRMRRHRFVWLHMFWTSLVIGFNSVGTFIEFQLSTSVFGLWWDLSRYNLLILWKDIKRQQLKFLHQENLSFPDSARFLRMLKQGSDIGAADGALCPTFKRNCSRCRLWLSRVTTNKSGLSSNCFALIITMTARLMMIKRGRWNDRSCKQWVCQKAVL